MCLLSKMLQILYTEKKERIVLISNYTETLDIFQEICMHSKYPFLRLDGATSVKKRQQLVDQFNDPKSNQFAFLLSRYCVSKNTCFQHHPWLNLVLLDFDVLPVKQVDVVLTW